MIRLPFLAPGAAQSKESKKKGLRALSCRVRLEGGLPLSPGCSAPESRHKDPCPPVINISPNTQRLVVGSPSISLSSYSSADLHGGGLVLDTSLPFNVTSSNIILLLNCSRNLLFSPLKCTSRSLCSDFLAQDTKGKPWVGNVCCSFIAGGSSTSHKIGTVDGDCMAYVSVLVF